MANNMGVDAVGLNALPRGAKVTLYENGHYTP